MSATKKENQIVYDVVMIGAGISASNAAYILRKRCKHLKILMLEAKDRVGGRTHTIDLKCSDHDDKKTAKFDIGAQW